MARLRPSASPMWVPCPGAVQMQEAFPETTESESARQGTATHWVGEQVLNSYVNAGSPIFLCSDFVDKVAPNGYMTTEEMAEGADMYVTSVLKVCQAGGLLQKLRVEQKVKIPRIHPTESEGTPDAWVFNGKTLDLYLWDLKFGYGIVEPFENWQFINYAIGILDTLPPAIGITVHMIVVQPRAYRAEGPIKTWTISANGLGKYLDKLKSSAELALSPNPPTKSGPHCKHCTALHACKTAHHSALNAIDVSNAMAIEVIPANQLKLHRETLERAQKSIENRVTAIDAQIIALIKKNEIVDGLAIDNPPGHLAWTRPVCDIIALGQLSNVDLSKPGTITPTQAKKLIDESVIKMYSNRPPGKTKIVDSTNSKAARVFGNKKVT